MAFKNFTGLVSAQGTWSAVSAKAVAGALVFATVTSGYEKVEDAEQVEYPLYMVWAHNQWLRMPDATAFYTLKKQVENHETRIAALEEAKANFTVTDGKAIDLTYENGVLSAEAKISAKEGNGVSLENDGLFVDVKSLQDAIAAETERAEGAEGDLQDSIDDLVELIGEASKGEDEDTIIDRIEALENATEISLADGEKILSLDEDKKLAATLTIDIEKQGEGDAAKEYIVLKGVSGAEVSKVDASAFVKDGMIESVAWKEGEPNVLVITWNTDAGKTATEVDMSKFIDTYTSGNEELLTVEGYVITPVTGEIKENETGLAVAGDVWAAVNAEEERATGVEEGLKERIEALEALEVTAEGDNTLVTASADGYDVTVGATKKLSDAVAKIEGLSVSATDGVTLDGVTYKYEHPTFEAAEAAAVKVGRDAEGHVVLGAALDAADIALDSDKDLLKNADDVEAGLEALADVIDAIDQSETTLVKKSDDEYISLDDAAAEGSNDHDYSIGLVVATEPTLKDGLTSSKPTATGLASDKYVDDSITNALAWDVIG